jgi:hypothetical protein
MRQLSLFKGERQRGIRPPPALEFSSHVLIADMLRRWCSKKWRWTHLPLGEVRDHQINPKTGKRFSLSGQRLQRMGVTPGWPDFLFAGPGAKTVWLELKRRRTGRLSEAQEELEQHLRECGFDYLVTDNVNEAIDFLKGLGILRAGISFGV